MKTSEFVALARRLAPSLPGFAIKGPMVFMRPVGGTLRGLHFEGSSFDKKAFYVWYFFLPLCVPTEVVSFNLGKRLRCRDGGGWDADMPRLELELAAAIQRDALPFLRGLERPKDVAERVNGLRAGHTDLLSLEMVAFTLARARETVAAMKAFDRLLSVVDPTFDWERENLARAQMLRDQLVSNPESAAKQLERWEAESIRNLGLEEYR